MANGTAPFGAAMADMMKVLNDVRPMPSPPKPKVDVSVASLAERSVGLGGLVGLDVRGGLQVGELKAVRFDALVRYDVWGDTRDGALFAATDFNSDVLGRRDSLREKGVLKLSLEGVDAPDFADTLQAWRVAARFRLLYEFPYQDAGGAESLIVQIPIGLEPEESGAGGGEEMLVTDELVRWDDVASPPLVVRGPIVFGGLTVLSSGVPTSGTVTVTRTFDGATGAPGVPAGLAQLFEATPASRHASVTFGSVGGFFVAVGPAGVPTRLGDRDEDGKLDLYVSRSRAVAPPLELGAHDRLEIAHGGPAVDKPIVIYLRATRG
jgi:hypothetical protein